MTFWSYHILLLIGNFNLVLPFNNATNNSFQALTTFLFISNCGYRFKLDRQFWPPKSLNHVIVCNPSSYSNLRLVPHWSYFLMFKSPRLNLPDNLVHQVKILDPFRMFADPPLTCFSSVKQLVSRRSYFLTYKSPHLN